MSFVKNLAVFGEHLPNSFKIFPKSELCKGANQTRFSILSTPNPIKPTYASQPCNLFFNHTKTGTISWIKIPGSWSSSDQTFSLAGPLLTVSQHFFHEKTRKGLTTLHQASFSTASFEQIEHLKRVFKVAQADPDANEGDLYSVYIRAAYKACKEGQWNLIEKFDPEFFSTLKDKQGRTLLSLCIENGEEKIISELLQRKIGVNEKDSKGNTPLHIAARLNFPSLLKVLLHYFSPDAHNFRGETALHLATQKRTRANARYSFRVYGIGKTKEAGGQFTSLGNLLRAISSG